MKDDIIPDSQVPPSGGRGDILIKNILLPDMSIRDIAIFGKYITQIGENLSVSADKIIDGTGKAVIPGLVNGHTHAAMTLFRGFGDDLPLMTWLKEKIWPYEAKLTEEDIYWGSKLACLEMIKSGTTSFYDMYYWLGVTAGVVDEMGLRACLSTTCFDHFESELGEKCKADTIRFFSENTGYSDRIQFGLAPHAIYTVSGDLLKWANQFSAENNLPLHIHVGETEVEVNDCLRDHGCTPVRYLNRLGVLSPRMVIAHGIYIDDEEIKMLADHDVKVVHNPASNMKLASGAEFKFMEMQAAGITVGLGTDGCASSNNLDMVEAMKLGALLGKAWRKDPQATPAEDVFRAATLNGAIIMNSKAGKIAPGYLADLCLVDLRRAAFTPNFNFISNLVYAANGSCIDTVICDGKIIMENKYVNGEEEILERAAGCAYDLIKR